MALVDGGDDSGIRFCDGHLDQNEPQPPKLGVARSNRALSHQLNQVVMLIIRETVRAGGRDAVQERGSARSRAVCFRAPCEKADIDRSSIVAVSVKPSGSRLRYFSSDSI